MTDGTTTPRSNDDLVGQKQQPHNPYVHTQHHRAHHAQKNSTYPLIIAVNLELQITQDFTPTAPLDDKLRTSDVIGE
jgi:hypothetical protein